MSCDRKMLDREAVRSVIQQWNANRLDLFALSEPDENLLFHGVMRFYFQDAGQKIATKCIRVASDATVTDVIDTLIEKFRPDMRMLSVPNYALYEVHANGEERRLNPDEKPLLVQLNWHIDDREGRFLLKNIDQKTTPIEHNDTHFKRKLSKREKKEQKKKEKIAKLNANTINGSINTQNSNNDGVHGLGNSAGESQVAGRLYTELPETSFTRSISNPEAVMRRRRQQKLEKKLQQFRSRDGGPDTGGTLKIYGESLCQDVPYKTLLLSIRDCAQAVVREMLTKYGLEKVDPLHYCLVQVNSDGSEYILDDDECPLSILMNHPTSRGSIMFHVRRRPADSQPRRRKKKPLGSASGLSHISHDREGPLLVEVIYSGDGGRRIKLGNEPIEVGSAKTNCLQLFGPSIQPRHCLISLVEGVCTVTPLHADALTFVNGHHITQPTILHNGSVVTFGRVASYRFLDSPSDGRYNLALSQSQLDSACLYERRSPTTPGDWPNEERTCSGGTTSSIHETDYELNNLQEQPNNNNRSQRTILDEHSERDSKSKANVPIVPTSNGISQLSGFGGGSSSLVGDNQSLGGNLENEAKSISSLKSNDSNNQERTPKMISTSNAKAMDNMQGQELILPAVLEFPETHQDLFLRYIITELDVNAPYFKLAPVYTLYLCARYRASTHYRPELQPTERAHKLTLFLHHVANLIYNVIQENYSDPRILAFWMANSSEFLHFLKTDRHISAFSIQAQEVLAETVQTSFQNLVHCFRLELSQTLNQFLSETIDHDSAGGLVLTVLGSAMALLRRCRVNAALTIQLFSQLFHYINVICFNTIVANSHMCTTEWGKVMTERLQLLELWAERQGLELAADCHLAKINQCAQFLQASKTSIEEIQQLACSCFRLNSLQMAALLQQEEIPRNLIDTAIRMAESVADELTRADGREIKLEETPELQLALLLPDDGFSCDVVRGIPSGLVDFLNPLQQQSMCRLAAQPTSIGLWTVYTHQFNARSTSAMSNKLPQPEVQVIKLHKNSNGMGLSIVAAKGSGQERLGIYIKSVVPGGAADSDGRLQGGDQLLRVDGQSLIGITQERAADYLVRTGPIVTLEVAKQGAIYHGLASLLQQPSPIIQRGNRRMSERDLTRMGGDSKTTNNLLTTNSHLPNSKSVPTLHHHTGSGGTIFVTNPKSRSTHSLTAHNPLNGQNNNQYINNNEQSFYQNLNIYRQQNQSQPALLSERIPAQSPNVMNTHVKNSPQNIHSTILSQTSNNTSTALNTQQQPYLKSSHATHTLIGNGSSCNIPSGRPVSAYYQSNSGHHSQHQQLPITNVSQLTTHHPHGISASNTNLSGLQTSQTLTHHQQHTDYTNAVGSCNLTLNNRTKTNSQNFNRNVAGQQNLCLPQTVTPSLPNISNAYHTQHLQHQQQQHLSAYNAPHMTTSQSMQNINTLTGVNNPPVRENLVQQQHSPTDAQSLHKTMRQDLLSSSIAMNDNVHYHSSNVLPSDHMQPQQGNFVTLPLKQQTQLSPSISKSLPSSQYQHKTQTQSYTYSQQTVHQVGNEKPPLPPTTTHPLYKAAQQLTPGMNYVASTLDPPKGGYVPLSGANMPNHKNISGTNPWAREEREKEVEMRREHVRQWREQQINELSNLARRTPQQEEQLKTLILERDFERRAQEMDEQEDEAEPSYNDKHNIMSLSANCDSPSSNIKQSEIKVAAVSNSNKVTSSLNSCEISPLSSSRNSTVDELTAQSLTVPGGSTLVSAPIINAAINNNNNSNTTTMQPKSILKNNRCDGLNAAPSSPSKSQKSTSFADDCNLQMPYHPISNLSRDISYLSLSSHNLTSVTTTITSTNPSIQSSNYPENNENNNAQAPPPPPERNSSYLIMSQQKLRNSINSSIGLLKTATSNSAEIIKRNTTTVNNNNNDNVVMTTTSAHYSNATNNSTNNNAISIRDNKRVSFHDHKNNYITDNIVAQSTLTSMEDPQQPITSNVSSRNDDCNNVELLELSSMSVTPDTNTWNTSMQTTPGVIGAQEVYRDPRQRRLAEKQQQQQQRIAEAVPEKLSFKEKMKMFALESGEDNTPKDKLKISRAQRDIDAVH